MSCKHFAHSNSGKGKAVGVDDEINVADRLSSNRCDGFIGFYSTIASSGLNQKLQGLSEGNFKEFKVFHRGNIEESLFRSPEGLQVARRYFPESMKLWDELRKNTNNALVCNDSEVDLKMVRQKYYEEYIERKRKKES